MSMGQQKICLGDKEIVNDFLSSQKYISSSYNILAGECANTQLMNDVLNVLADEHRIQSELFCEANSRGWYQLEQADAAKINQTKTKLSNS